MSELTVALSSHPSARRYASIYARLFGEAGAQAYPTVNHDDIQPDHGYWGRFGAYGPESIQERLKLIQTAGVLAVVTAIDRPLPGSRETKAVLAPSPEQQIEIAVATGAQVPVCMLDGFPGILTQGSGQLATPAGLEGFGVTPFSGEPDASFGQRVQWALSYIQHQEGSQV